MTRAERLAEIARIAVAIERETNLPAQLLIAQWALESRWGEKPCGRANYFGMKRSVRHKNFCKVTTREVIDGKSEKLALHFADYDSLEESARDYAWLLTHGSPYARAWEQYQSNHDVSAFINGVAVSYATDPRYAELVSRLCAQEDVIAAIENARGL